MSLTKLLETDKMILFIISFSLFVFIGYEHNLNLEENNPQIDLSSAYQTKVTVSYLK